MRQVWRYAQAFLKVVFRHPITGTTIIPILPDGRIVLIQRQDTGQWGLPGGLVDWGEDLLTAAQRELKEETGLKFLKVQRLVGVYSSPNRDPRMHAISIVIAAQVQGDLAIQDSLEVLDVKAFAPEDLPLGKLSHDHDRQLTDFLAGSIVVA
jgi:8-oxo-dGTP diphosphatase